MFGVDNLRIYLFSICVSFPSHTSYDVDHFTRQSKNAFTGYTYLIKGNPSKQHLLSYTCSVRLNHS